MTDISEYTCGSPWRTKYGKKAVYLGWDNEDGCHSYAVLTETFDRWAIWHTPDDDKLAKWLPEKWTDRFEVGKWYADGFGKEYKVLYIVPEKYKANFPLVAVDGSGNVDTYTLEGRSYDFKKSSDDLIPAPKDAPLCPD